jgi:hypothetical protein
LTEFTPEEKKLQQLRMMLEASKQFLHKQNLDKSLRAEYEEQKRRHMEEQMKVHSNFQQSGPTILPGSLVPHIDTSYLNPQNNFLQVFDDSPKNPMDILIEQLQAVWNLKNKDLYVLYCYRPSDTNSKIFIPYRTGVIGIFKTLDEVVNRQNEIQNKSIPEYKGYQLFIAKSKIIESEKDYEFPLGFNEAF